MNTAGLRRAIAGGIAAAVALVGPLVMGPGSLPSAQADRLVPTAGPVFWSNGKEMVSFGGYAYFTADDGVHGKELWRTDGTPAGTTLVYDAKAGLAIDHGNPDQLTVVGNRLYFRANVHGTNQRIFFTTADGTVTPVTIGAAPATGFIMGAVNNKLLFSHYSGTGYPVHAVGPTGSSALLISVNTLGVDPYQPPATMGGWMYFSGHQADSSGVGAELYRTNGSLVQLVKNIHPTTTGSAPRQFVATSNRVFFNADDGQYGRELWSTDGTAAGTTRMSDHQPLSLGTQFQTFTAAIGSTFYYVANDAIRGRELFSSDGTVTGTRLVKEFRPGLPDGAIHDLGRVGQRLLVARYNEVWASDGTAAGTTLLTNRIGAAGHATGLFTPIGNRTYFRAGFAGAGNVVWRTDGTPAGTHSLTAGGYQGAAAPKDPYVGPFAAAGTKVVFTSYFAQPDGGPYPVSARRVQMIDTTQPDPPLTANPGPVLSGPGRPDTALRVTSGRWSLAPASYRYQWLRNGQPIGANQAYYWVTAKDVGSVITVRVTVSALGAPERSVLSRAVKVTRTLAVTSPTRVKGTARVGRTLKAVAPKFNLRGVRLSYQWFAGSKPIARATKAAWKLTAKQRGQRIRVVVTGRLGSQKVVSRSARTKPVARR